jgi:hypothetical protein
MLCPKCSSHSPQGVQFCTNCHTTLRFTCPKCWEAQYHGGACDSCGADFKQYQAVYLSGLIGENARETKKDSDKIGHVVTATQITVTSITSPWMALLILVRTVLFQLLKS